MGLKFRTYYSMTSISCFDRVHPFVPILRESNYLSWNRTQPKTESRMCLQYAMWTLVSAFSVQLVYLREPLYRHAGQLLELAARREDQPQVYNMEIAQSRLLLIIYDMMLNKYQLAWMNCGYCLRLVQSLRLYDVDNIIKAPEGVYPTQSDDNWVENEEKRRLFWMAYIVDCFLALRFNSPITFDEQMVSFLDLGIDGPD